jgi:hypothetical protein
MVDLVITFGFIAICIVIALFMVGSVAWLILQLPSQDEAERLEELHRQLGAAEDERARRLVWLWYYADRSGNPKAAHEFEQKYRDEVAKNRRASDERWERIMRLRQPYTDEEIEHILSQPVVKKRR